MQTTDIHSKLSLRAFGPLDKKASEDTLAHPAKGFALCTPTYEWMPARNIDIPHGIVY